METSFAFTAKSRLRKSQDFARVQKNAEKLFCKHFLVLVAKGETAQNRLGITVTLKINKRAVVRNKIKRLVREVFRNNQHKLRAIFDIVVIARKNADELQLSDVQREILGSLKYRGYLKSKPGSTV